MANRKDANLGTEEWGKASKHWTRLAKAPQIKDWGKDKE